MDKKEILENTKTREELTGRNKKRSIVAAVQSFLWQPSCSQQLPCVTPMAGFGVLWKHRVAEWAITLNFCDNQGFPYETVVSKMVKILLYCLLVLLFQQWILGQKNRFDSHRFAVTTSEGVGGYVRHIDSRGCDLFCCHESMFTSTINISCRTQFVSAKGGWLILHSFPTLKFVTVLCWDEYLWPSAGAFNYLGLMVLCKAWR